MDQSEPPVKQCVHKAHTWQGTLPLSKMGSPLMSASAIVPGPAFVMMVSTAAIHCTQQTIAEQLSNWLS
jgi:hypothetical protein